MVVHGIREHMNVIVRQIGKEMKYAAWGQIAQDRDMRQLVQPGGIYLVRPSATAEMFLITPVKRTYVMIHLI